MCLALPARIVALDATDAVVDIAGRRRRAALSMRPNVAVGDWALVAAGCVVRRIDVAEARALELLLEAATSPIARPTEPPVSRSTRAGGPA